MAGDRIAEFLIGLSGDDSDLRNIVSAFKSRLKSDVADLQATADKLDLFGQISDNLPKVQAAFDKAKAQVKAFKDEIAAIKETGAVPIKALTDGLAASEKAARDAGAELKRQTATAANLGSALSAAGVNTKQFAAEQLRLSAAVTKATADLQLQQSKDLLGFKSVADVKPRIDELTKAFDTLKASGKLSASEIAVAQQLLDREIQQVRASVTGLGAGFTAFKANISSIVGPVLATTAALSGVTAVIVQAIAAAKEFESAAARIGTVTTGTREQITALSRDVLDLSRRLGIDANEALKATFELIRSGVPQENALTVLEISAKAAKAALTDTATGAKAASILLDAFGLSVDQLPAAFDAIIASGQRGGATLSEFAQNAAGLGNAARAVGADFNEVIATLRVMTDASNDAAGSAELLAKILIRLASPDVQLKLAQIGLAGKSLLEVFTALADRGIPINQFLDLGIASGKAGVALSALTNNARALAPALQDAAKAAGAIDAANAKLANTAVERSRRLDAEWKAAQINLGEAVGAGSRLSTVLADVLADYNAATSAAQRYQAGSISAADATGQIVKAMLGIKPAAEEAAAGADELTRSVASVAAAGDESAKNVARLGALLATQGATLTADAGKLQAALEAQLGSIDKIATEQQAALKLTTLTAGEQAQAQIAIEESAARDKLKILADSQAALADAARKGAEQIAQATLKASGDQKKAQQDAGAFLLGQLQKQLADWTSYYASVTQLAQQHLDRAKALEQERVSFNESIERQLFDIRLSGLSSFDQYVARVREAERLAAEAREVGARGDAESLARAKQLTQQALDITAGIGRAFSVAGTELISQSQAEQKRVEIIKGLQGDLNRNLAAARDAEKNAADQLKSSAEAAKGSITDLRIEVLKLQTEAFDNLVISVKEDTASFAKLKADLDALTAPRTVFVTTQTTGGGEFVGPPSPFAHGGYVPFPKLRPLPPGVAGYASGGAVWKVPGVGSGDTVPGLLQAGSFVIRKSASQYFGDDLMAALTRGYADGGSVLSLGGIAERFLTGHGGAGPASLKNLAAPTPDPFADTFVKLQTLLEALRGTPPTSVGTPMAGWIKTLVDLWPQYSASHREQIKQVIDSSFEGWLRGIQYARLNQIPVSIWAGFPGTFASSDLANLTQLYARGGSAGDTVPAMLTPGEWVIPPRATAYFGSELLSAVNSMRITKDVLARFAVPMPPRLPFASGGPVPGASIPARGGAAGRGDINITINAAGGDLSDPATLRRTLFPAMREIQRRSS